MDWVLCCCKLPRCKGEKECYAGDLLRYSQGSFFFFSPSIFIFSFYSNVSGCCLIATSSDSDAGEGSILKIHRFGVLFFFTVLIALVH